MYDERTHYLFQYWNASATVCVCTVDVDLTWIAIAKGEVRMVSKHTTANVIALCSANKPTRRKAASSIDSDALPLEVSLDASVARLTFGLELSGFTHSADKVCVHHILSLNQHPSRFSLVHHIAVSSTAADDSFDALLAAQVTNPPSHFDASPQELLYSSDELRRVPFSSFQDWQ